MDLDWELIDGWDDDREMIWPTIPKPKLIVRELPIEAICVQLSDMRYIDQYSLRITRNWQMFETTTITAIWKFKKYNPNK